MIYNTGTVTIVSGSAIVSGTGTKWNSNNPVVSIGMLILIKHNNINYPYMIKAVNSDNELVLAETATFSATNTTYTINLTEPNNNSDAARALVAANAYIIYFLQNMDTWLTETGVVEITLPSGKAVKLESIKALQELIKKTGKTVGDKFDKNSVVQAIGSATDKVMSQKANTDAFARKTSNEIFTAGQILSQANYASIILNKTEDNSRFYIEHGPGSSQAYMLYRTSNNENRGKIDIPYGKNGMVALKHESFDADISRTIHENVKGGLRNYDSWPVNSIAFGYTTGIPDGPGIVGPGLCWGRGEYKCQLVGGYSNNKIKYRVRNGDNKTWSKWFDILTNTNTTFDANGFLKRASPIVKIHPDGSFETNGESEGVNVQRVGVGSYFITGVIGYNADGAWGINAGISVPKNSNGLELIYIKDKVLSDGNIEIQTFHRQHSHLPDDFQNWRVKDIIEGKPVYYADGEQVDIPMSTWLDVRVEMPPNSVLQQK
ncbi:hypothetical protein [Arsenophonus apicola]|jgi:hypothetical protein|uniref:phage tail fiber protein n=1 Tax=Arsenophonus apicola TaxID=2879119 RepID=UPI003879EE9A